MWWKYAREKSVMVTDRVGERRILEGQRFRWTMPMEWRLERPVACE